MDLNGCARPSKGSKATLKAAHLYCSSQWGIPAMRSTMIGRAPSDEWEITLFSTKCSQKITECRSTQVSCVACHNTVANLQMHYHYFSQGQAASVKTLQTSSLRQPKCESFWGNGTGVGCICQKASLWLLRSLTAKISQENISAASVIISLNYLKCT